MSTIRPATSVENHGVADTGERGGERVAGVFSFEESGSAFSEGAPQIGVAGLDAAEHFVEGVHQNAEFVVGGFGCA
jgi:hypothetical protein